MSRMWISQRVRRGSRCTTGWPAGTAVGSASIALAGRLLVLFCALGAANAALAADEIHWTLTGQTSVTFDWRGTGAEDAIWYGTSPGAYTDSVIAATPSPLPFSSSGPFWEAKLTGLQEDTLYYYAIGSGPEHTFRTPPPRGSAHFTIYAEGDIGSTNTHPTVADVQAQIANGLPAFVLMVGDLTYGNNHGQDEVDQHFNDVMGWSREAAYMPAWGNNDWATGDDLRNYKGRFDFPNPQTAPGSPAVSCCGEDWYWFDYGNVRFIAYPEPWSGAWTDWNTKATTLMAAAQADPAITFIVTFGHRPAYSSGAISGSSTLKGLLDALGDRYRKYVLNVSGHSHNYERSFPQHGVVHVVAGTGGTSATQLSSTQPSWSAFRAQHLGAFRVHFTPTAIEGAFICGPPGGGTNNITCTLGSVVDGFTIGTVGSDQSPPAVRITVPGSGATVFGTTTVTALAADNVGVVGVQVHLDGNALGREATTAPYAVAWDTTTATAGAHVLTAVARDAAGNTATSPEVPVIVHNDVTTLAFPPSADATIQFDFPTTNSGAASTLEVDESPLKDVLMKFVVSGVGTRPVLAARLRLHVVNPSDRGGDFRRVAESTWSEQTVTWNTAPAADAAVLASLGAVSGNTWVELDLTSLITGDGEVSLRVTPTSSDGADYSSREAAGFAPQLLVTVANQTSNQAPNGVIDTPAGDVTIQAGQSVSFTGTGTDPDGNLPLTYVWTFGGGATPNTSTLEDPGAITFPAAGTYTVTFTVTDSRGLADPTPATRVVTVTGPNQAPDGVVDTPAGDVTIQAGQSVSFTGTGTDPDGNLPLTYVWTFGGGATPNTSTLEDPGAITFPAAGTYTVTFTVTDSRGLADPTPATRVVTVTGPNQAPDGVIDTPAGNVTIQAGQSVSLTGTGTDPDGNLPLTYMWTFGGGATPNTSTLEDPGAITFPAAGTYTVTFTVTDSRGTADPTPATRVITVTDSGPNQAPDGVIDAPAGDVTIQAGQSVTFTGTGTDPDGNTPLTFLWTFGGGATPNTSTLEDPGAITFPAPGTYTVTFTVTDSRGTADPTPATRVVTVTGLAFAPTADATIKFDAPTTNSGASAWLEVDASPVRDVLMKFSVSGIGARTVRSARLRLHVTDGSKKGGDFYRVADSTWSEQTVTWNTAPAPDSTPLASLGAVSVGAWVEVDLTSLITGDGVFSLRAKSTSTDGAKYDSKDVAGFAPQLVVTFQ